jgi:hypothetical protein
LLVVSGEAMGASFRCAAFFVFRERSARREGKPRGKIFFRCFCVTNGMWSKNVALCDASIPSGILEAEQGFALARFL